MEYSANARSPERLKASALSVRVQCPVSDAAHSERAALSELASAVQVFETYASWTPRNKNVEPIVQYTVQYPAPMMLCVTSK